MRAGLPADRDELEALADRALDSGEEAAVEPLLAAWLAARGPDPGLAHWHALLLRALDRREEALAVLRRALAQAPDNLGLAHSLAQVALEAGASASAAFDVAVRLAPSRGDIHLGRFSALYAEGQGQRARDELRAMLAANPGWIDGHRQYAQLSAMLGDAPGALASIEAALARFPGEAAFYHTGLALLADAERFDEHAALVGRAIARLGEIPELLLAEAVSLDEAGRHGDAAGLFARLGPPDESGHAVRLIRHQLRIGAARAALPEIERWLAGEHAAVFWPYAALVWRLTGDPRREWLEAQDGLVRTVDLDPQAVGIAGLAQVLRGLHAKSGRFLDQSVRGGTQTDGPLFARIEPEVRQARAAVVAALQAHLAQLPTRDPAHPQLSLRRDRPVRFAGSWSVRLRDAGHHASHHHPQGWFSAVLYVAVPEGLAGDDGRLALGAPPGDLGLALNPTALVEPRVARLAIFPSTMWHATLPYSAGERMTVAFDIARPAPGDMR